MRPTTTVRVEGDAARKLLGLVETLEDLDDVIKDASHSSRPGIDPRITG